MPAELSIRPNGVAEMMYARDAGVPWHGLGTPVPTAVDSTAAIRAAGLDWDVTTGPLYGGPDARLIKGRVSIYRQDTGDVLGLASTGYSPIQNGDAFGFLDSLHADGTLLYDTAGALRGGATVWLLARVPDAVTIAGDAHGTYILLSTSHDGSGALRAATTMVRVVCANTLALAERDLSRGRVSVRHTGDVNARLLAARELLAITTESAARFKAWAEAAALARVPGAEYRAFESTLFGVDADALAGGDIPHTVAKFRLIMGQERERAGGRATWYTVLQGVTGYADHALNTRGGDEGRFSSVLMGAGAQFKARGYGLLRDIVKV